jgi:hypothetical protein
MRQSRTYVLSALCFLSLSLSARAADIEKFLPKDTDAVLSVNVKQIVDSAVFKKNGLNLVKETLEKNKDVQLIIQATGIDPLKDFERITIGLTIDDPKSPKVMMIFEGKFDPKKITSILDAEAKKPTKIKTDTVNGKTIYKFNEGEKSPVFGAVLDSKTIVLGSLKEYIGTAFEAAQGTAKVEIHKDLSALLAKADSQSSLYFASIIRGKLEKLPLPDPNIKKVIEQIYNLTIDIKAKEDVDLRLGIGVATADSAKQFEQMAQAGVELLKAQIKVTAVQNPELEPIVELVNSLKVTTRGSALILTGVLKSEAIEKAIKDAKN